MGNACSCEKLKICPTREITLLMIGLDNAGKTCTVKHLIGEPTSDAVPTVGFSSASLKHGKYQVKIFDLGGGPKIRAIWQKYFALVHGLIFVVDASDPQRLEESKTEIGQVLRHEKIAGKPMLVLVNKQDVSGAVDETEVVRCLDLEYLVNQQKCPTRVEASCALHDGDGKAKDTGIEEGFGWLIGMIARDFGELHQRLLEDISEKMKEEEREKSERIERVNKIREERQNQANCAKATESEDDNDNDVIIGNPFKPSHVIRSELEERGKSGEFPVASTPAIRVIHVSPANSPERKNSEEIILRPQMLPEQRHRSSSSSQRPAAHSHNGSVLNAADHESGDQKKKNKKTKKRFKNRVVPEVPESKSAPLLGDLPPLKPSPESNGQASVLIMSRPPHLNNGSINWTSVEELEPCKETSLTGCRRFEAWSDSPL